MSEFPKKVEIARKNWYETDCKGLSVAVIKDAYERGFNRAYRLMKVQQKPRVLTIQEIESGEHPFAFLEYRVADKDKTSIKSIIRPVLITHTLNNGITMMHNDDVDLTEWKDDYNKTYRLWNNDPTDVQIEAVKWDA